MKKTEEQIILEDLQMIEDFSKRLKKMSNIIDKFHKEINAHIDAAKLKMVLNKMKKP